MAFTMVELRQELHALGYGGLPDDFIVSSLSQLQLDIPQSLNKDENVRDRNRSNSSRRVRFAGKPSRHAHGPPVPGDREFATSKTSTLRKGGTDSICFTPDFATELDEMRKMLKAMQGTKEELFDTAPGPSSRRIMRKQIGLADEHEIYVGNLLDQWRVVGRSMRSKRKECLPVDTVNNFSNVNAETGTVLDRGIQLSAESSKSVQIERPDHGCDLWAEVVNPAEGNEGIIKKYLNVETEGDISGIKNARGDQVDVSGLDKGPRPVFTRQESSSAISPGVSYQQGGMLYPENFTIDTHNQSDLIKLEETPLQNVEDHLPPPHQDAEDHSSLSASPLSFSEQLSKDQILEKLSYMSKDQFLAEFEKSLDDLYPKGIIDQETFANVNQEIADTISHTHVSVRHHISQQPIESENPLGLGVPVLVRAPDRRGGGGLRHQSPLNDRSNMRTAEDQMVRTTESNAAKALKRSSTVMLQRSRSSRVVSRRNEIVEEANDKHPPDIVEGGSQEDSNLVLEKKTTPPPSARKLKSDSLGQSKSFSLSRRRNEIVEEPNRTHLASNVETRSQVDSHLLADTATTPPSSTRKLTSERLNRLTKSAEKGSSSARFTFRHNRSGSALDKSETDIPSLGLSPITVREQPASTLNYLSTRERACVANDFSEHRLGSHCSACQPVTVPKSSESNLQSSTTGTKCLFESNESPWSETEASPQHKRSAVRKEIGEAEFGSVLLSKQKLALKKGHSGVLNGISTALVDPKNNDLKSNSKFLLKSIRLASSMDFSTDCSRLTERRPPSLRSSTESSRSSGPQRAPSAQPQLSKTNSVSSYAKSSFSSRSATPNSTPKDILSSPFSKAPSFTSYGSRSSAATKNTLTPGGPRRGGKVDRVARVIEDMRPTSNEPPPFVVPTALYDNAEGLCTF